MSWNQYASSGSSINITWPTASTNALSIQQLQQIQYVPLAPITDPSSERDFRALRDLTPVEWLRRQVNDVCFLARAA